MSKYLFLRAYYWFFFCLAFLFVYAVNVNGLTNFSYVGVFLLPLVLILYPGVVGGVAGILRVKWFWLFLVIYISMFVMVASYPVIRLTNDFGFAKPMLHTIASIPACVFIASFLDRRDQQGLAGNIAGYQFTSDLLLVQTLFILVMLAFPEFKSFADSLTKTSAQLERMGTYGGGRGLGLSGSVAFGLATTMGLLLYIVFFLRFYNNNKSLSGMDFVAMFFVFVASMSAGRTAIAGATILFATIFLLSIYYVRLLTIVRAAFVAVLGIAFLVAMMSFSGIRAIDHYFLYVFQPIQHYLDYGDFQVSSVKALNEMYYVPGQDTLLAGDARYMSDVGPGYYGGVDAGYMRGLLYWGVLGSILFYSAWLLLFIFSYFSFRRVLPGSSVFFASIFVISLIFQYKGEFVFVAVSFNKIMLIFLFYLCLKKRTSVLGTREGPELS